MQFYKYVKSISFLLPKISPANTFLFVFGKYLRSLPLLHILLLYDIFNHMSRKKGRHKKKNSVGRVILRYIGRFFLWFFVTLLLLLAGGYCFFFLVNKGPSPHFRDVFVVSAMESSAGGILAKLYLTDEEIAAIQAANSTVETTDVTDVSMIRIGNNTAGDASALSGNSAADTSSDTAPDPDDPDGDGIEIHEVKGAMYRGAMMIVHDPSRVKVSSIPNYTHSSAGWTLEQHIEKNGAIGGINGGKYEDESGLGIGGWPEGIVISGGKLLNGTSGTTYGVYGFTNDNVLVVGNMTPEQAMSMGVRDAVTFGPALIVNGKAASYQGIGSGLNPRTAIGQREDGAVLLLVIEGRKTSSLGAAMSDLIEIMQEYGAVNAANLDGGMSSAMIYNNEHIVDNSSIRMDRQMPTAFIVMP